jgi:site-specific DNA recombinase
MMRCALYIRVSSRQQVKGVSLDDQVRACRAHAERMGWTIVEPLYIEPGRSAYTERLDKRVAFQQMLNDAKRKVFDIVLVYKLDRFARKTLLQYQAAAELERYKVQIASATEPIDRKTAAGRMTFGMLAVAAEAYSDQLSERMKDVRRAEARQGRHVGPVPVGYVRGADGKLNPSPDARDVEAVRSAFTWYRTSNESALTLTRRLNDAGYTWPRHDGTRAPFHKDGVIELLQNPVYIGRITGAGVVVENAHEPLIDHATWDAVQAILTDRRTQAPHGKRTSTAPARRQEGVLVDLAYCSNCGARLWYLNNPGRYYRCSCRTSGGYCNAHWSPADAAEARVFRALGRLTLPPEWRAEALKRARQLMGVEQQAGVDRVALEARIKRLGRLYEDGLKTEGEYERELASLRAQLAAAPVAAPFDDLGAVAAVLGDLSGVFAEASVAERRAVLMQLVDQVYLKRDAVLALRPTLRAWPLMQVAYERSSQSVTEWAGWGSNPRPSV